MSDYLLIVLSNIHLISIVGIMVCMAFIFVYIIASYDDIPERDTAILAYVMLVLLFLVILFTVTPNEQEAHLMCQQKENCIIFDNERT